MTIKSLLVKSSGFVNLTTVRIIFVIGYQIMKKSFGRNADCEHQHQKRGPGLSYVRSLFQTERKGRRNQTV
jgi:hypothetical protein